MKSFSKFLGAVAVALIATGGVAFANPPHGFVPEPGSMALVGIAIAGAIAVSRRAKKK